MSRRYFDVVTDFRGYRNREDITNLKEGYMVYGSQNVLTTVSGKVGIRGGYTLDGEANSTIGGIKSAFDCLLHTGEERHLRFYGTVGQFRYLTYAGAVTWHPLLSGTASPNFNCTTFWNTLEQKDFILMVNGQKQIIEWSGGATYLASATGTTITKTGTSTWNEEGFYNQGNITGTTIAFVNSNPDTITDSGNGFIAAGFYPGQKITVNGSVSNDGTYTIKSVTAGTITLIATDSLTAEGAGANVTINSVRQVTINGTVYTYTGGETTTTLTGVTPSPAAEPVHSIVAQTVRVIPDSALTGIGLPGYDLISTNNNQVYIASLVNHSVYLSYVNDYTNFSSSLPRLYGEGGQVNLDGSPVGFIPFNGQMYISAGKDLWYETVFTESTNTVYNSTANLTITTQYQSFNVNRIPAASRQGAKSQAFISQIRNNIAYISNEPSYNYLGFTQFQDGIQTSFYDNPTITDVSDPIKFDFDAYDFEGGSIAYHQNFTFIAVPREGLIRIYNHEMEYWEAPQTMSISRFSIIDGELYGHSDAVPETYKLFEGTNDLGNPIYAVATFSYRNFGTRNEFKNFNEYYAEGYITGNTKLYCNLKSETEGCGTEVEFIINGNDPKIVCLGSNKNLLGKFGLGKQGLGSIQPVPTGYQDLPPKFRIKKTFSPALRDFYEIKETFYSDDIDQVWEVLAFGPKVVISSNDTVSIKQ